MLEDLMNEIYGGFQEVEETEQEKKERQKQETEETIQLLRNMGQKK